MERTGLFCWSPQLQAEVQTLHQEARQQQQQESQTPDIPSRPKTPDSSEDSEADERLKDVLSRAQRMQTLVRESLSSSLPVSSQAEVSSLSRWESEPGLSSSMSPEVRRCCWSLLSVGVGMQFASVHFCCSPPSLELVKHQRAWGRFCSCSCFVEIPFSQLHLVCGVTS